MMNRLQEIEKIKRHDMRSVLSGLNIAADTSGMFPAVWRSEKNPSCHILRDRMTRAWVFFDHGTMDKGTNIDLVMKARGWDYADSVRWLRDNFLEGEPAPIRPAVPCRSGSSGSGSGRWLVIEKEESPYERFGLALWEHRRIVPEDCRRVGIESIRIQHSVKQEKKIWVLGHRNLAGGWNCFMPEPKKFKTVVAPDGLGWDKGDDNSLIVSESILDGLAVRKIYDLDADIVYARVPLAARIGKALLKRPSTYDRVILATDNDSAGNEAAEIIGRIIKKQIGPVERMKMKLKDPCEELLNESGKGKTKS